VSFSVNIKLLTKLINSAFVCRELRRSTAIHEECCCFIAFDN